MMSNYIYFPTILVACWLAVCGLFSATAMADVVAPMHLDFTSVQDARVTAFLPYVTGMANKKLEKTINETLSVASNKSIQTWNKTWNEMYAVAPEQNRVGIHLWLNYQLNYNDENMLSLLFHQSSFMGGAHPADYYYSCNIDLLSGKNIQLVDLFSKDYDYKTLINNFIKEDINLYKRELDFKGITDNQSYYLSNEGLIIYFNPADIAPRVYGIVKFILPYRIVSFAFAEGYNSRIH